MEEKVKKPRKKKSAPSPEVQESNEAQATALSPHEQAEMLRNYVASMEKVQGFSAENVRDIIDTVYRRLLLVLNYSTLSKEPAMKDVKAELKRVYKDEMDRYKDEEVK